MSRPTEDGRTCLSRETKLSGMTGDRGKINFLLTGICYFQLTTSSECIGLAVTIIIPG